MVLHHETQQSQANQIGDSPERIGGTHSTTLFDPPCADNGRTMIVSSRQLQPRGNFALRKQPSISVTRNVTFDERITVNEPTDWSPDIYHTARIGPWMQAAVDRHRFERRIKQTEDVIGHIFSAAHRDSIKLRFM